MAEEEEGLGNGQYERVVRITGDNPSKVVKMEN